MLQQDKIKEMQPSQSKDHSIVQLKVQMSTMDAKVDHLLEKINQIADIVVKNDNFMRLF